MATGNNTETLPASGFRFFLKEDYRLVQRTLVLLSVAGFFGHFLFYFVLSGFTDYWESFWVRLVTALLFVSLLLLPRRRKFRSAEAWYYEIVYMLVFPSFFVIHLFQNDVNTYWAISVMFATIPYGLLTNPPKALFLYPAGVVLGSAALYLVNGSLPKITDAVFIHFPAYFMVILLGFIQTTIRKAYAVADRERQHSEELLKNILPVSVIKKLKEEKTTIAEKFDNCSILFADVVDFTPFAEKSAPENVVNILNEIFTRLDHLTEKYGLEKIKTVGDAYMVASGVPVPRADHAETIADMALDILATIEDLNRNRGYDFRVRLGINSGPAVAGVIGKMKFAYDIWGDTVNTASRMESMSVAGKIQITEDTYQILKDKYHLQFRDTLDVKGKGRLKTYFLEGRKD